MKTKNRNGNWPLARISPRYGLRTKIDPKTHFIQLFSYSFFGKKKSYFFIQKFEIGLDMFLDWENNSCILLFLNNNGGSMLLHTISDNQFFFPSYVFIWFSTIHHYLSQYQIEFKLI
jgi:hypothetical protein